jgi:hypothetical protein
MLATGLALLCGLGQVAASGQSTPAVERVMARLNVSAPPAYRAYRRLDAGMRDSSRHGWLEAWTEFHPSRGMSFEIAREGGNEYVRHKVLRKVLTSEQQLIAKGLPLHAPLDARNYRFEDGGTTDGLQRVVLKAARNSDGIVNGSVLLSPETGDVTQIAGRLVKSPSFWVTDVDVVWTYARVGGQVLPVEMTSSGRVRMVGRSMFKMVYDYVSIQGQPVATRLAGGLRPEH